MSSFVTFGGLRQWKYGHLVQQPLYLSYSVKTLLEEAAVQPVKLVGRIGLHRQ